MNLSLAKNILLQLAQNGVREFVVCAGARNAPLVNLLGQLQRRNIENFRMHTFFDERAAAFFALGLSRRDQRAVAVITTSGTAAAELLPAAIEAYYSGTPLVFVTADRPKKYRGKAAPQSIEQAHIFGQYARENYDWDNTNTNEFFRLSSNGMTHINVCFVEPLIDETELSIDEIVLALDQGHAGEFIERTSPRGPILTNQQNDNHANRARKFLDGVQKPLLVLGAVPARDRAALAEYLNLMGAPVYAEAHSGLRESPLLKEIIVRSGDMNLKPKVFRTYFDSVIRVGSVPTLRLWRDLEGELKDIPVLSIHELPFSGLAREEQEAMPFQVLWNTKPVRFIADEFLKYDAKCVSTLEKNFILHPYSEPAFFRRISEAIEEKSFVFLGNSLPIRQWDLAATFAERGVEIAANRGANGIDGLISTFLGMCSAEKENWLVLGDLSALYDLNALALAREPHHEKTRIVVINNGGGQIFKRMFQDKNFLNEHKLEFSHWAAMFGWDYVCVRGSSWPLLNKRPAIIEVVPDNDETNMFWGAVESEVKP